MLLGCDTSYLHLRLELLCLRRGLPTSDLAHERRLNRLRRPSSNKAGRVGQHSRALLLLLLLRSLLLGSRLLPLGQLDAHGGLPSRGGLLILQPWLAGAHQLNGRPGDQERLLASLLLLLQDLTLGRLGLGRHHHLTHRH